MSKDIRSFFKPKTSGTASIKTTTTTTTSKTTSATPSKRKIILSSDEEDNFQQKNSKIKKSSNPIKEDTLSPAVSTKKTKKSSSSSGKINKRRILDSDEEEENEKDEQNATKKLKPRIDFSKLKRTDKDNLNLSTRPIVDINKMLGSPIKVRVDRPPANDHMLINDQQLTSSNTADLNQLLNDDDDVDFNIIDLIDDNNRNDKQKTLNGGEKESNKLIVKDELNKSSTNSSRPAKNVVDESKKSSKKSSKKADDKFKKSPIKPPSTQLDSKQQPADEDAIRLKKQQTAIFLSTYKNRGTGPLNPGSKEIPQSKPNCLNSLTFVITGLLDSLGRDEAIQLITNCGGKVTTALSKKTTYLICGEEAGISKMEKAKQHGTKIFTEDELFNLIRERSLATASSLNVSNGNDKHSPKKSSDRENSLNTTRKKLETPEKKIKGEIEKCPKLKMEKKEDPVVHVKIQRSDIKNENVNEDLPEIKRIDEQIWVDKYKPMSTKQIIGQQGAASNCVKLTNWLKNWYINQNSNNKGKLQKPSPWAASGLKNDGAYFKACLLSGQPGIGKTTTATLVCKELGFAITEFNASDTRSKKLLQNDVTKMITNKSLHGYFIDTQNNTTNSQQQQQQPLITKKHVLIMDEVDGMAGNEDRGGVQELIGLIKSTSIPIICMCNDVNHPKIRSLINHCYDLRFSKPRLEQIKAAMLSICFREKIKIEPKLLEEIILATNQDIRQTLNNISLLYSNKFIKNQEPTTDNNIDNNNQKNNEAQSMKKDLRLGPWDVIRKVFSFSEHQNMTIFDKSDLFFHDYSLSPLFVQQNYLSVIPNVPKDKKMECIAKTADSLSIGDVVDRRIRMNMAWSMLPTQAMFSSVLPGEYMAGSFSAQIVFPKWLGKNSNSNKRNRMAQELHDHTRLRTSASRLSIRLDYAPMLLKKILLPLQEHGLDGVRECLEIIKEYRLLREDLDSLIEITTWPGFKNPMDSIPPKVKAALTRAYNKEISPYTYTVTAASFKKRTRGAKDDDELNYENGDDEDEVGINSDADDDDTDNLDMDVLIKGNTKKKPSAKTDNDKPSTSKTGAAGSTSSKTTKTVKGKKRLKAVN